MDISHIARFKIAYNQDKTDRFKAGLKIGGEIQGRVAQVLSQDQYIVTLRGMNLVAQSDIPMLKGEKFRARIESTSPKLRLKIIHSASEGEKLARQWGVKEEGKALIAEMAAARIPLTEKNFRRLDEIVRRFARNPKFKADYSAIARAVVKLERQGISITEESVSRQISAVKEDFNIAALLTKLTSIFNREGSELPQNIAAFINNLPARLTPEMIQKNLPAVMILLGLLHESDLKSLLTGGKVSKLPNLKWILLKLLEVIPETAKEVLPLLNDLEAMQLRNLPENRSLAENTFYLQIPVYNGENWERLNLWLHSEKEGGKTLDKDNVSIRINLETKYLGNLSALAKIMQGTADIALYFEKDEIAEFVQPFLSKLQENVENIGFKIGSLSASTFQPAADSSNENDPFVVAGGIPRSDAALNMIV